MPMKRQNSRHGVALLLLALLVPILVACGGGGQQADAPTSAPVPATSAPAPAAPEPTAMPAPEPTAMPAPEPATGGQVLRANLVVWPDTMDPQDSSVANEIGVLSLAYEGLTRLDKDLKSVPAVAAKWRVNTASAQMTAPLR